MTIMGENSNDFKQNLQQSNVEKKKSNIRK